MPRRVTGPVTSHVPSVPPRAPTTAPVSQRVDTLERAPRLALRWTPEALIAAAQGLEAGTSPFTRASDAEIKAAVDRLAQQLPAQTSRRPNSADVRQRSASVTLLLAAAKSASGAVRTQALEAYVSALTREPVPQLRASMLANLDQARFALPVKLRDDVAAVRAQVLPPKPPYDAWFAMSPPKLSVRHYVMGEFWKDTLANYKRQGFEVISAKDDEVVLRRTLEDPSGQHAPVRAQVVVRRDDKNIFRDLDDPKVNVVIYSGHSQLGGVADASLREAPAAMAGDKLVAMFSCRSKQSIAAFKARYPEAHLSATFSSAYDGDDQQLLVHLYEQFGARGSYAEMRGGLRQRELAGVPNNYVMPDDARQLAMHDDDLDGLRTDAFFDPARRFAKGGANVFRAAPLSVDPQAISGTKLDHAIGYANTSFFYFAEANHAAPLRLHETDSLVSKGWFVADTDEPVRLVERQRDGKPYFEVSVNSRYADKSREVITAMVLYEVQLKLSEREGHVSTDDKLRGLILVAGYLDLFCPYSDQIDEVLAGFSRRYGFSGPTDYATLFEAMKRDGHEGVGSRACLDFMKHKGVRVG